MLVKGTGEAAVGTGKSGLDARDLPEDRTAISIILRKEGQVAETKNILCF